MNFDDVKKIYINKKKKKGDSVNKDISIILDEIKDIHYKEWKKNPTKGNNHQQSWNAFKGKNFEKLIEFILQEEIEKLGLTILNGNKLERTKNLSKEYGRIKRNISIDYGDYGLHIPDVDLIIYKPDDYEIIAVISVKVTLRERIAQTGYWKLKLLNDNCTKNIKVYFITLDEDNTLQHKNPSKKGRAIVENDLDGSYVLTKNQLEISKKVKYFENFIEDLTNYINQ